MDQEEQTMRVLDLIADEVDLDEERRARVEEARKRLMGSGGRDRISWSKNRGR